MPRPSLPDDLKRAQGTFDPRYSEAARMARGGATIVDFPVLNDIPRCRLPLNEAGHQVYDTLTRVLKEQGRLTTLTHMEAEALAGAYTTASSKMEKGQFVPMNAFTAILGRIDKLQRANIDAAFRSSKTPQQANRFARSGFASRHFYR